MILKFLTTGFVLVLTLGSMASTAMAEGVLPARVESALEILEARKVDVSRFSFDRQTYKKGAKTELKLFDPRREIPDRWHVAFPTAQDNPRKNAKLRKKYAKWDGQSDVILMVPDLRKRMAGGATLIETKEDADIFEFDIADDYILSGGGRKSEISEHVKGEIAIDIHTNLIRWIRYYAPEPFKPISIVKLKSYEIVQYIAPAWENGPLVRVYETSKVDGNAPFTHIQVDEIMINENMTPVETD